MAISVLKQADVFVRNEIDAPKELGRQAPGLGNGPKESFPHTVPTSLLPPLACLSRSQTLLSLLLSKNSSLTARRLKFGNREAASRLPPKTLAWKGTHG